MGHYSGSCIATIIVLPVAETSGIQIRPTHERIKELCEKLNLAQESELESLLDREPRTGNPGTTGRSPFLANVRF